MIEAPASAFVSYMRHLCEMRCRCGVLAGRQPGNPRECYRCQALRLGFERFVTWRRQP